jgi:hypothetical protein
MLPVWSVRGSSEARRPRDESRRSPHERGPSALAELPPGWGVFIRVRFASCPAGSDSPPRRSPTRMKLGHLPAVCAAERSEPCDPATPGDVRRVIAFEELFRGTIDGASVHAREVVKSALGHNAAACIIAHNHPQASANRRAPTRPSPVS